MNDNKIILHSITGARSIATPVTKSIAVAIGNGALVFHAGMLNVYQLVAILVKGIGAKPMFKRMQHVVHLLRHIPLSPGKIIIKHPVVEIKMPLFSLEILVKGDVFANVGDEAI